MSAFLAAPETTVIQMLKDKCSAKVNITTIIKDKCNNCGCHITKVRAESMLTYVLDESKLQLLEVISSLLSIRTAIKIQPKTITSVLRMFLLLAFKGKKML